MEITILHIHQPIPVTLLHFQGKLDGNTNPRLTQEVQRELEDGTTNLLLDLTHVTDLDPTGVEALKAAAVMFANATIESNPRVKLIHVRPELQKTLDMAGLNTFIETCTNLSQALDSFK